MSDRYCLQCGESEAAIKRTQRDGDPIYCAIVDYFGECSTSWARHRFADRTDKELDQIGVLSELRDQYRRTQDVDLLYINCEHRGREHTWAISPPGLCSACFHYRKGKPMSDQVDARLTDALRAVLDLHAPHDLDGAECCTECSNIGEHGEPLTGQAVFPYPCPTVQAIQEALGTEDGSQ